MFRLNERLEDSIEEASCILQAWHLSSRIGLVLFAAFSLPGDGWGEIRFRESSEAWGLEFRHHHGGTGAYYQPETDGSGVVLFDYDFDGDIDLYVTAFGPDQLFANRGDGTFTDVSTRTIADERWSSSAALGDADRDGDLDLYVVNYLLWKLEGHRACKDPGTGILGYCHVGFLEAEPDRLFAIHGDGTFEGANTGAIGARVALESGGRTQTAEALTASSYLSQSAATLHFGLGREPAPPSLLVRWPAGSSSRYLDLPTGHRLRLYERPR